MKRLNILKSKEQWLELRKIQNTQSHAYEDEPEEMSIAINAIFDKKQILEELYKHLIEYSNSNAE